MEVVFDVTGYLEYLKRVSSLEAKRFAKKSAFKGGAELPLPVLFLAPPKGAPMRYEKRWAAPGTWVQ
jgi:hypothetical protein